MNKEAYNKVVEILSEDRKEVRKGKRRDYTKGSEDVLANFKNQARDGGITPLQSLFVHMEKQISAVFNYIKTGGEHESEPIIKRIGDSINYLELLWGLINDKEVRNWDGINIDIDSIREKDLCKHKNIKELVKKAFELGKNKETINMDIDSIREKDTEIDVSGSEQEESEYEETGRSAGI